MRKETAWGVVSRQVEARAMGHLPLAVLALVLLGLADVDSQTKVHIELMGLRKSGKLLSCI